jgi:hypothetical protein|tara:strand:+ start:461 stop:778 length:318 start_codon:yes stop_codon:yes gene_type:complete
MKTLKSMLVVLFVVGFVMLSGCTAQDGGLRATGPKIDKDGFSLFELETNGSQVAVGDPNSRDSANTRFNTTVIKKEKSSLFKENLKRGATTDQLPQVTTAINAIL